MTTDAGKENSQEKKKRYIDNNQLMRVSHMRWLAQGCPNRQLGVSVTLLCHSFPPSSISSTVHTYICHKQSSTRRNLKTPAFCFCGNGFHILKIKLFKNGIVMTIMWFLGPNFPQTQFHTTMTRDCCCIGLKISQIKSWEKRHD